MVVVRVIETFKCCFCAMPSLILVRPHIISVSDMSNDTAMLMSIITESCNNSHGGA